MVRVMIWDAIWPTVMWRCGYKDIEIVCTTIGKRMLIGVCKSGMFAEYKKWTHEFVIQTVALTPVIYKHSRPRLTGEMLLY